MAGETIFIKSRKYDGTVRRTWTCELIEERPDLLTFVGVFDRDVEHAELGFIRKGTISYEYYWPGRWYNVFRFHEPDGTFRNFYCNLNLPPMFANGTLDYVDLDIDVLVWPDGGVEILDQDDFEAHARIYCYPDEIHARVDTALTELLGLIERRKFPFSFPDSL